MSLVGFARAEILFLLDRVSRAGVKDPKVWDAYSSRTLAEVRSCSLEELCLIVRALCRVGFAKRGLLNAVCRRLRAKASELPPRLLAQVVSDLRKLGHLDGPLLLALAGGVAPRLPDFRTFDLPLLLHAFAKSSCRDEQRVATIGGVLQQRLRDPSMSPTVASTALFSLALLDCGEDGTAAAVAEVGVPRHLVAASRRELVAVAYALVVLDLPQAELLSYVLERLARQGHDAAPREVHALQIVNHCVRMPAAFRPAMRKSFEADAAARNRCVSALDALAQRTRGVEIPYAVTSSKLQRRLERFFDRLQVPHKAEEAVGPYILDYALPGKVAVEVDGYKHYYAFSRRLTAKSDLKLRILAAMGWRVVSLPHFEWLPKNQDERLVFLVSSIEAAAGAPVASLRSPEALPEGMAVKTRRSPRVFPRSSPPVCGRFGGTRR